MTDRVPIIEIILDSFATVVMSFWEMHAKSPVSYRNTSHSSDITRVFSRSRRELE